MLFYLNVFNDVTDSVQLPLQVVCWGATERRRAVLRGAVYNLSTKHRLLRREGHKTGNVKVAEQISITFVQKLKYI